MRDARPQRDIRSRRRARVSEVPILRLRVAWLGRSTAPIVSSLSFSQADSSGRQNMTIEQQAPFTLHEAARNAEDRGEFKTAADLYSQAAKVAHTPAGAEVLRALATEAEQRASR